MPKIIEAPKDKILAVAKERLFAEGYRGLSLRGVAAECGVSVGTIYNYYQNKDMLIATIMMEDWQIALAQMQAACQTAATVGQGVGAIYDALATFSAIYAEVWAQFAHTSGAASALSSRHHLIRGQIEAQLSVLLCRLGRVEQAEQCLIPLLGETLLAAIMQADISRDDIIYFADRLF